MNNQTSPERIWLFPDETGKFSNDVLDGTVPYVLASRRLSPALLARAHDLSLTDLDYGFDGDEVLAFIRDILAEVQE